jgi:sterol desaturase/sphingolipid hydroxylase (fatty acid hydroxylase superfamily)
MGEKWNEGTAVTNATLIDIGLFIAGFLASHVIGSLAEYVVHVCMHRRIAFGKTHTFHHKAANGQGVWGEFLAYLFPAAPAIIALFCVSYFAFGALWLGIGFVVGGIWACAFSAYGHQLSHERPELIFWLRFPPHHIHHFNNLWRTNFGVTTLLWDRLFGTYQHFDWNPQERIRPLDFFRIHWISENPVEDWHRHDEVVIPEAWLAKPKSADTNETPQQSA